MKDYKAVQICYITFNKLIKYKLKYTNKNEFVKFIDQPILELVNNRV